MPITCSKKFTSKCLTSQKGQIAINMQIKAPVQIKINPNDQLIVLIV